MGVPSWERVVLKKLEGLDVQGLHWRSGGMAKLDMKSVSKAPRYVDFPEEQVPKLLEAGWIVPAHEAMQKGVYVLTDEGWVHFAEKLLGHPTISPTASDGSHRK